MKRKVCIRARQEIPTGGGPKQGKKGVILEQGVNKVLGPAGMRLALPRSREKGADEEEKKTTPVFNRPKIRIQ